MLSSGVCGACNTTRREKANEVDHDQHRTMKTVIVRTHDRFHNQEEYIQLISDFPPSGEMLSREMLQRPIHDKQLLRYKELALKGANTIFSLTMDMQIKSPDSVETNDTSHLVSTGSRVIGHLVDAYLSSKLKHYLHGALIGFAVAKGICAYNGIPYTLRKATTEKLNEYQQRVITSNIHLISVVNENMLETCTRHAMNCIRQLDDEGGMTRSEYESEERRKDKMRRGKLIDVRKKEQLLVAKETVIQQISFLVNRVDLEIKAFMDYEMDCPDKKTLLARPDCPNEDNRQPRQIFLASITRRQTEIGRKAALLKRIDDAIECLTAKFERENKLENPDDCVILSTFPLDPVLLDHHRRNFDRDTVPGDMMQRYLDVKMYLPQTIDEVANEFREELDESEMNEVELLSLRRQINRYANELADSYLFFGMYHTLQVQLIAYATFIGILKKMRNQELTLSHTVQRELKRYDRSLAKIPKYRTLVKIPLFDQIRFDAEVLVDKSTQYGFVDGCLEATAFDAIDRIRDRIEPQMIDTVKRQIMLFIKQKILNALQQLVGQKLEATNTLSRTLEELLEIRCKKIDFTRATDEKVKTFLINEQLRQDEDTDSTQTSTSTTERKREEELEMIKCHYLKAMKSYKKLETEYLMYLRQYDPYLDPLDIEPLAEPLRMTIKDVSQIKAAAHRYKATYFQNLDEIEKAHIAQGSSLTVI